MNLEQILEFEFFQKIPRSQAEDILAHSETIVIHKDEILFKENDIEPFFYFVLKGEILIFKEEKNIAIRGAGEYFGEMALIDEKPRAAGAKALTKSTLLKIGEDSLDLLISTSAEFSRNLLQTLVSRNRDDLGKINQGYKKLKVQKKKASNLNRILDDTSNEIYTFDQATLKIVQMNKRSMENLGYSQDEINTLTPLDILAGISKEDLHDLLQPLISESQPLVSWGGNQNRKNGISYPVEVRFQLMEADSGPMVVAIVQDISERVKMEQDIRQLAYFDSLTFLPNRNKLVDDAKALCKKAEKEQSRLALFHLDLDDFKRVNDSLGPQGGDILLFEVCERLKNEFRSKADLYRLRGDEYALLMPGVNSEEGAQELAEKIMELVNGMFHIYSYDIHLTCSVGIALYPQHGKTAVTLIRNGDLALTRAKHQGKAQCAFYDSSLEPLALDKLTLVSGLKKALEIDEFYLDYQPKVDAKTKLIVGAEALLRWQNPEKGRIAPCKFVPVAEESQLIVSIGEWVLRNGFAQLKKWHEMGFDDFTLAVNFSPIQFNQKGAVSLLREIVESSETASKGMEIELTEGVLVENTEEALEKLKALHDLGLHLSIDDFGTGYSSMQYLKDMPIDCLKIDRGFVHSIESKTNQAIIHTIVNLAKKLGLTTVAEGVETPEEEKLLESMGCDLMQGYLFSRPVSPENLEALLSKQAKVSTPG